MLMVLSLVLFSGCIQVQNIWSSEFGSPARRFGQSITQMLGRADDNRTIAQSQELTMTLLSVKPLTPLPSLWN